MTLFPFAPSGKDERMNVGQICLFSENGINEMDEWKNPADKYFGVPYIGSILVGCPFVKLTWG